jgi:hypothetical protein
MELPKDHSWYGLLGQAVRSVRAAVRSVRAGGAVC